MVEIIFPRYKSPFGFQPYSIAISRSYLPRTLYFILPPHLFLPVNESVHQFFSVIPANNLSFLIRESVLASKQRVLSDRILTSICFSKMSLPFPQDSL